MGRPLGHNSYELHRTHPSTEGESQEKELGNGPEQETDGSGDEPEEGGALAELEDENDALLQLHGRFLSNRAQGTWGNLPPRLQQAIGNASTHPLPLRYRRLLKNYHGLRRQH